MKAIDLDVFKDWEARPPEINDTNEWEVQEVNYKPGDTGQVICDLAPTDHTEANARLIAAAPELLIALDATLRYARGEVTDLDLIETSRLAEAAMLKATGGQAIPEKVQTTISVKWSIIDVIDRATDQKRRGINQFIPTDKQALDILQWMERKHDANIGINWDVIDSYLDMYEDDLKKLNKK